MHPGALVIPDHASTLGRKFQRMADAGAVRGIEILCNPGANHGADYCAGDDGHGTAIALADLRADGAAYHAPKYRADRSMVATVPLSYHACI